MQLSEILPTISFAWRYRWQRQSGGRILPGVTTALMLEQMMDGYEVALAYPGKYPKKSAAPAAVRRVLEHAFKRRWHHLAEERIEDVRPKIPMGRRFWPLAPAE